ncbi:ABC transporter ATP-binding protein [Neofamilia massiliensis]|uniref:ABC transporter ATP-binding protein n=1 Tax=Neofamilia massiliensis TaxID=1673724 RepID=UPI0006BB564E|nr:ABC transporter ATP-binding protein [Neofamilia massiliensis]
MEVLKVENLQKSFGKKEVLKDLSFTINEGEILGFLGRNGSGKSTTMKCLSGLMAFDSGSVSICGFDIKKDRIKALEKIGVSIESPALYPNLSAYDHYKQMAAWRKIPKARVQEMIDFSNLGSYLKKPVSTYSMGMKMRLMLSLVIMHKPKLLILDEPMNGLDFEGVLNLRKTLVDLKNSGSSILLSSHQLSELEKISDRVLMIENGKVVYDDKISGGILELSTYDIDTSDNSKLIKILEEREIEYSISKNPATENYISFNLESSKIGSLLEKLFEEKIYIKDISKESLGLEELYQSIIEVKNQ